MEEDYVKQTLDSCNFISEEKIKILKLKNIKTLGKLSNKSKKDLKEYGFEKFEINRIDIELQLRGLSLREK